MSAIINLTIKSLRNRKIATLLTLSSIAVSVSLLIGVERMRNSALTSFESTISETDLIVGARSGPIQLLLYSVFHLGHATNNITWQSYENIRSDPSIKWTIPLSLGDSHRGFRVVGTTSSYFKHLKYGRKQSLSFQQGKPFNAVYEAVIGSQVAKSLAYTLGKKIILSHGLEEHSFQDHKEHPFKIVGILEQTGTPIDKGVYVKLESIEAIHLTWGDDFAKTQTKDQIKLDKEQLKPKQITAFLLGLKRKLSIFKTQRSIQEYEQEPLSAILPGVSFQELWQTLSTAELALRFVSYFVILAGILGMIGAILTSLNERRREMAILRSLGAKPSHIFTLFVSEALFLGTLGSCLGLFLISITFYISKHTLEKNYGLYLDTTFISFQELIMILIIILSSTLAGIIPAWRAYSNSLADGLTIKV